MYTIHTTDDYGEIVDAYERTNLEEVRELIIELVKDSQALPDRIKVYQQVNFSCGVTVEFTC